ncbi:hypothetical protein UA08_07473 [Talaromyces atroroseus]|uniref:Uncharacterized protein n=1 Tax=Talaromyces atroroseus TaxID=1441469 RepID=A0A225A927_TALAT|nr:hypothetical protein UA08_07473 [Talaromyces atroroseus]OKL57321.1 hypothetical protein UA08_07473 [Talaromyces atroroseus]
MALLDPDTQQTPNAENWSLVMVFDHEAAPNWATAFFGLEEQNPISKYHLIPHANPKIHLLATRSNFPPSGFQSCYDRIDPHGSSRNLEHPMERLPTPSS